MGDGPPEKLGMPSLHVPAVPAQCGDTFVSVGRMNPGMVHSHATPTARSLMGMGVCRQQHRTDSLRRQVGTMRRRGLARSRPREIGIECLLHRTKCCTVSTRPRGPLHSQQHMGPHYKAYQRLALGDTLCHRMLHVS